MLLVQQGRRVTGIILKWQYGSWIIATTLWPSMAYAAMYDAPGYSKVRCSMPKITALVAFSDFNEELQKFDG